MQDKSEHFVGAAPGDYQRYNRKSAEEKTTYQFVSYNSSEKVTQDFKTLTELENFYKTAPQMGIQWIDIQNFDPKTDGKWIEETLNVHPLSIEDTISYDMHPKFEEYDNYYFVLLKHVGPTKRESYNMGVLLFDNLILSISNRELEKLFDPLYARISTEGSKIRRKTSDYLFIAIIDLLIDTYSFQVKQFVATAESLERKIFESNDFIESIRPIRKQILWYRSVLRPTKEVLVKLSSESLDRVDDNNLKYIQDTTEHLAFLVDQIDDVKETTLDSINLYLSLSSQKMNEVVKLLTLISSIFIPITFVAGIYGMNFDTNASNLNMPELSARWGYPGVLLLMAFMALGSLLWFRRKGWF